MGKDSVYFFTCVAPAFTNALAVLSRIEILCLNKSLMGRIKTVSVGLSV